MQIPVSFFELTAKHVIKVGLVNEEKRALQRVQGLRVQNKILQLSASQNRYKERKQKPVRDFLDARTARQQNLPSLIVSSHVMGPLSLPTNALSVMPR